MCLGVPGKVIKKWTDPQTKLVMAQVDFDGLTKDICLDYQPDAKPGDYVLVHVGFAIGSVNSNNK